MIIDSTIIQSDELLLVMHQVVALFMLSFMLDRIHVNGTVEFSPTREIVTERKHAVLLPLFVESPPAYDALLVVSL